MDYREPLAETKNYLKFIGGVFRGKECCKKD